MNPEEVFTFPMRLFTEQPPTLTTADGCYNGGAAADWAKLPKMFLFYLMKFLNPRTDFLRLRSVCHNWRAALPVKQIPKLPLGFDAPKLRSSNLPVFLSTNTFYLLSPLTTGLHGDRSDSPWIVRVSDYTHYLDSNKFRLHNPIDGTNFVTAKPPLRGQFSLLDCNVQELYSSFSLLGGAKSLFGTKLKQLTHKVVGHWDLGSPYLFALLAKVTAANGGGLLFLRMGENFWNEIKEMEVIDEKSRILRNFDAGDIAFYDGDFYAFDYSSWKVGIINVSELHLREKPSMEFMEGPTEMVHQVIEGVRFVNFDGQVYALKGAHFVPSKEGLYMVFELGGFEAGFVEILVVYELDEEEWEWNKVESIGDQIFFIGLDSAFSVPAESLPQWKSGSICLFTKPLTPFNAGVANLGKGEMPEGLECLELLRYQKYWKCFRMFNMEEEENGVVPFEELSMEVYTGLFFPPPPWVKLTTSGVQNVEVKFQNLKLRDEDEDEVDGNAQGGGAETLEEVE